VRLLRVSLGTRSGCDLTKSAGIHWRSSAIPLTNLREIRVILLCSSMLLRAQVAATPSYQADLV
jgi:hypothetical protein